MGNVAPIEISVNVSGRVYNHSGPKEEDKTLRSSQKGTRFVVPHISSKL